jgi:hypothetical protein
VTTVAKQFADAARISPGWYHTIEIILCVIFVMLLPMAVYLIHARIAAIPYSADLAWRMCENHTIPEQSGYIGAWDAPCQKIAAARLAKIVEGWNKDLETKRAEDLYELDYVRKAAGQ